MSDVVYDENGLAWTKSYVGNDWVGALYELSCMSTGEVRELRGDELANYTSEPSAKPVKWESWRSRLTGRVVMLCDRGPDRRAVLRLPGMHKTWTSSWDQVHGSYERVEIGKPSKPVKAEQSCAPQDEAVSDAAWEEPNRMTRDELLDYAMTLKPNYAGTTGWKRAMAALICGDLPHQSWQATDHSSDGAKQLLERYAEMLALYAQSPGQERW